MADTFKQYPFTLVGLQSLLNNFDTEVQKINDDPSITDKETAINELRNQYVKIIISNITKVGHQKEYFGETTEETSEQTNEETSDQTTEQTNDELPGTVTE